MPQMRSVDLPDGVLTEVEKIARAKGRSVADVMTEAAQQYIDRQELEETLSFGERHAKSRGLKPGDVAPAIARVRDDHRR